MDETNLVTFYCVAVGLNNVSKKAEPLAEIEEKYRLTLKAGGRYHPPYCRSHHKVAIIIPYRDRQEHLHVFLQHMHPFLQRQQLDYGIFVVEQSGANKLQVPQFG